MSTDGPAGCRDAKPRVAGIARSPYRHVENTYGSLSSGRHGE
jgi:hypothetical protein